MPDNTEELLRKLEAYKKRQAQLEAERKTLTDSINQLETGLKQQYGEDWETKYDQSVKALNDWSEKNGNSPA